MLGAAAAHLPSASDGATQPVFQTALQFHQFHALGLLTVGLVAARFPSSRWFIGAGWLMVVGTLFFSGNIYLRILADFNDLHAITPYGGGAWILAWVMLAIGVLRERG